MMIYAFMNLLNNFISQFEYLIGVVSSQSVVNLLQSIIIIARFSAMSGTLGTQKLINIQTNLISELGCF